MTNKEKLQLVLVMLLAFVLRLHTFKYPYINIDETDYTLAARVILNGGLPYKDFLIYQPPVIYYIFAAGLWLAKGASLWGVRLITNLIVAATCAAIYGTGRRMSGHLAGLAAAFAYAVYSTTFIPQDMFAANCEVLMMLPMSLAAYTLARSASGKTIAWCFFAGIFIGLGFLTKYQGGVVLVAALFYTAIASAVVAKKFSIKANLLSSAALLAGFFLPPLLFTLYIWKSGALSEAWEAFRYIVLYAKGPPQSDPLYVSMKFIVRAAMFALPATPMWFGAWYVIVKLARAKFSTSVAALHPAIWFVVAWFFLNILPVTTGGRIYFHYFIMTLPPAAILAGIWWSKKGVELGRIAKGLIVVWLLACVIGWNAYAATRPLIPTYTKETWVGAAKHLKEIAKDDDTLFVWGLCYQLYFYTDVPLATRFTSADYLTGRSPMTAGLEFDPKMPNPPSSWQKLKNDFINPQGVVIYDTSANIFPKAWDYLKEDFSKKLPTYIIDTQPSNYRRYGRYPIANYPFLADTIARHYERTADIDGYVFYKLVR